VKSYRILILLTLLLLTSCSYKDWREYRQAIKTGNPRVINRYIAETKSELYAGKASDKLEKIYYQRANTEASCLSYLANYPEGIYVEKVNEKLEDLIFERATSSIFAVADYIRNYPQGKYRDHEVIRDRERQLRELIRRLSSDEIEAVLQKVADTPAELPAKNEIAVIETPYGIMKMRFFTDKAPIHCANFKRLAESGYYDGVTFHRVIPGFMIQGGDINSRDGKRATDGRGGPGYTIRAEFNDISHQPGIVSMARTSDPNSAGSQFFICDGAPNWLDGNYTVFGEIFEGKSIIKAIANVPRDKQDNPLEPVYMRVTIVKEK
jgi:peptidyl-prolyl cis-trans isomerase B (cyclophilin B)